MGNLGVFDVFILSTLKTFAFACHYLGGIITDFVIIIDLRKIVKIMCCLMSLKGSAIFVEYETNI